MSTLLKHTHTYTHKQEGLYTKKFQVSNGHFQKVTSSLHKNLGKIKIQNLQSTKQQKKMRCSSGQDPGTGIFTADGM